MLEYGADLWEPCRSRCRHHPAGHAAHARLAADPLERENYEFAMRERFLLGEDRTFLKLASAPHARRARSAIRLLHPPAASIGYRTHAELLLAG